MKFQKGIAHLVVIVVILALIGIVAGTAYYGKQISQKLGTGGIPSGVSPELLKKFSSGGFSGPGGCSGPDCEQVCSKDPKICQEWCEQNPQTCAMFMGGGPGGSEAVEPPVTTITFAKTVNFNADQFTEQDISKAKKLGANMVTIWPGRAFKDDEYTFSFPERFAPMINFAHKNGLQVELRSSYGGDTPRNYEKYKANALEHVADFAKFAEKYKVYRIVPFGEIDNNLISHCSKITEFSAKLLQEMRKHYSGQIGIGVVAPWRDCGFNFAGYDYLTASVYPQTQTGMDAWLTNEPEINLNSVTDWARTVADRSSIKILHIGETGVQNIGEKDPSGFFQTVAVSKEKEAEFYQKAFSLISAKVNGFSAFYNSRVSFLGINGDPAEKVVKEWYSKL